MRGEFPGVRGGGWGGSKAITPHFAELYVYETAPLKVRGHMHVRQIQGQLSLVGDALSNGAVGHNMLQRVDRCSFIIPWL